MKPTTSRQLDLTFQDNNLSLANVAAHRYQNQQRQQDSITMPRLDNDNVEASTSNDPINNNLVDSNINGNGGKVEEKIDPVFKCWEYRYNLFSKFDDGIMLDRGMKM